MAVFAKVMIFVYVVVLPLAVFFRLKANRSGKAKSTRELAELDGVLAPLTAKRGRRV